MFRGDILQKPLVQGDMELLRFVCDFGLVKKIGSGSGIRTPDTWIMIPLL